MPENNTLVHGSAEWENIEELIHVVAITVYYLSFVLTSATLIYGVLSWCIIKKFRNYRNYVFLNAILVNFMVYLILYTEFGELSWYISNKIIRSLIIMFFVTYIVTAKLFWLIVICHMFYVDIVKVFGHISRRYLSSSLFGWGASLSTSLCYILISFVKLSSDVIFNLFIIPMTLNSLLYIVIVCTLFRSSTASANTGTSKWRRLYIATLIFILSDGLMFFSYVLRLYNPSTMTEFLEHLINLFNSIILNVYLVLVMRNRQVWREFYVNKLNGRQRNGDIEMDVKSSREI